MGSRATRDRGAGDETWNETRIAAYREEATSGDYDHLLAVVQRRFEVQ